MAAIMAGMDEWRRKTCVRVKKRTIEAAHVTFFNPPDKNKQ